MAFLGGLLVWVILLGTLAIPLAIGATIVWHLVVKARRAQRRAQWERRPRQPYDDAYERALWEQAAENGERDARRRLGELEG